MPDHDLLSVYTMSADGSDVRRVATLTDWPIPPGWAVLMTRGGRRRSGFAASPGRRTERRFSSTRNSLDAASTRRASSSSTWMGPMSCGCGLLVRIVSMAFADAAWSPDGSRIAVLADRERKLRARGNPRPMVVMTVAPDGTDMRVLATGSVGTGVRDHGAATDPAAGRPCRVHGGGCGVQPARQSRVGPGL